MGVIIFNSISSSCKDVNFYLIDPSLNDNLKLNQYSSLKSFKAFNNFTPDVIIFAIKPQDANIINDYSSYSSSIILSIMAGKNISFFEEIFGGKAKIFRIMPNIFAQYKKSSSLMCNNKVATKDEIERIKIFFSSIGSVIEIDENDIDFGTIIASSMPAFIFEFIKHFYNYTIKNSKIKSPELLFSLILDGMSIYLKENKNFDEIINHIASKGGITETGLNVLQENNLLKMTIEHLIQNCILKSKKLQWKLL